MLNYPPIEIEKLKQIAPCLSFAEEGGLSYILIEDLKLPDGCQPRVVNALLCPSPRDGYESRLFFSDKIASNVDRNWNGNLRILENNWYAISWKTQSGLGLAEMLLVHLDALR